MSKIAPLTKMIITAAVTVWALLVQSVFGLALLVVAELVVILLAGVMRKTHKALGSLAVVALCMVALQYALATDLMVAVAGGFRMMVMAMSFIILLATARVQDLSAALVNQCYVPPEYAFMFTTALRFIPDFIAESKAVQEAQACRGYMPCGNIVKRSISYLAIVKPLVLKAIRRSETMSMSLELRGFGSRPKRSCSFSANVALARHDYLALIGMVLVTTGLMLGRL